MFNQNHSISLLTLPQCKSWLHEQVDKKKKQQKLLLKPLESNICDVMSFDIFSEKAILWNLLEILKLCGALWNVTILENYDIYNLDIYVQYKFRYHSRFFGQFGHDM